MGGKSIPGRENSQCKGPEAGVCLPPCSNLWDAHVKGAVESAQIWVFRTTENEMVGWHH